MMATSEWIFLATNLGLEMLSAACDQASSPRRPHFALFGMLLAIAAVLISIGELIDKGKKESVVFRKGWFYHRHPPYKPFGTLPDIFGLVAGISQCICSMVQYVYYLRHADSPFKVSLLPAIFLLCLGASKLSNNRMNADTTDNTDSRENSSEVEALCPAIASLDDQEVEALCPAIASLDDQEVEGNIEQERQQGQQQLQQKGQQQGLQHEGQQGLQQELQRLQQAHQLQQELQRMQKMLLLLLQTQELQQQKGQQGIQQWLQKLQQCLQELQELLQELQELLLQEQQQRGLLLQQEPQRQQRKQLWQQRKQLRQHQRQQQQQQEPPHPQQLRQRRVMKTN